MIRKSSKWYEFTWRLLKIKKSLLRRKGHEAIRLWAFNACLYTNSFSPSFLHNWKLLLEKWTVSDNHRKSNYWPFLTMSPVFLGVLLNPQGVGFLGNVCAHGATRSWTSGPVCTMGGHTNTLRDTVETWQKYWIQNTNKALGCSWMLV